MTTLSKIADNNPQPMWWNQKVFHLQLLLIVAFLFGGGGSAYGLLNLTVQVSAIICLAVNANDVPRFFRYGPKFLPLLVCITIALPLSQIIPLPPLLWQSLPGRELVVDAYAVAGISEQSWIPISAHPMRTLVAACSLLPPLAIISVGSSLTLREIQRLAVTVIVLALISVLYGVFQVSSANQLGLLYEEHIDTRVLYGFIANRNSTGIMLVCTIALVGWVRLPINRDAAMLIKPAVGGLLAIAVIMTQSRSSIALLAMVVTVFVVRWLWSLLQVSRSDRPVLVYLTGLIGCLLAVAVAMSAIYGGTAGISLDRFSANVLEDDRPKMWEDALFAAEHYWPAGSGIGTFDEVFQIDESLEFLSPGRAGRAHNDYLEMAIESGPFGITLAFAWIVWIVALVACSRKDTGDWRRIWPGLGILVLLLQSIVDYPLRNQTMLCLAALVIMILAYRPGRHTS